MISEALKSFGKTLVPVDLPELPDEKVFVRSLTAGDRLVIEQIRADGKLIGDHEFCFLGAFTEKGERLFTPEDAIALDGRIASRIAAAVLRASGIFQGSAEAARKK